jgi:hypothetical protein
MSKYLISYDLNGGEDSEAYEKVINYITSYKYHAKALYSQWVIKTDKTASEIRDDIKNLIDSDDVVLVVEVTHSWASYGLPKEATELLKS